jgi:excisionase family DNA binding protein
MTPDTPHDMTGDTSGDSADAVVYIATISDAARLLRLSVRTVQRRLDNNELEATTMAGKRCVRIRASDLPDDPEPGALDGLTLDTTGDVSHATGGSIDSGALKLARDTSHDNRGEMAAFIGAVVSQAVAETIGAQEPRVMPSDKLLLTLPECQALTGLSRAVLRDAIEAGDLKARQMGRPWRVKRADLEAFIETL